MARRLPRFPLKQSRYVALPKDVSYSWLAVEIISCELTPKTRDIPVISASSSTNDGLSIGSRLSRDNDFAASASFPTLTRKRGVSGRKDTPPTNMRPQANWMAIGMRYEPVSFRYFVALSATAASRRPIVMES